MRPRRTGRSKGGRRRGRCSSSPEPKGSSAIEWPRRYPCEHELSRSYLDAHSFRFSSSTPRPSGRVPVAAGAVAPPPPRRRPPPPPPPPPPAPPRSRRRPPPPPPP